MTAAGLSRLLARLHSDSEQAGHEYERLRRALVKFFDWRGALAPDDCADEAIDRLARKLEDTTVDDVLSYAHGIARLVLLEHRRAPSFSSLDGDPGTSDASAASPADDDDRVQECLDRCLASLPAEARALVLRYYEGERAAKISSRRRLAESLRLSDNALRSRVQRLRDRLEECLQTCLSLIK